MRPPPPATHTGTGTSYKDSHLTSFLCVCVTHNGNDMSTDRQRLPAAAVDRQRVTSAPADRQRVWRGLPQPTAPRRERKESAPAIIPMVWDPSGDENAQQAALRAATRAKARPPELAPSFSTFVAPTAVRPPVAAALKDRSHSEPGVGHRLTAARAAVVCEDARKKQAAAVQATRMRADQAAVKPAMENIQPLQLARESLATSERSRRLRDQPSRLRCPHRAPPSETGQALLAALGIDENDWANPQRPRSKISATLHQTSRTKASARRLNDESTVDGGGGGVSRMPSSRTSSRAGARPQSGQSRNPGCHSDQTPFLGIGFEATNPEPSAWHAPFGQEPAASEAELEVVGDLVDGATARGGDVRLQALQGELERVRQLEAMLQQERERGALMKAAACT